MSTIKGRLSMVIGVGLAFILALGAVGCGDSVGEDSRTVGGACESNSDCDDRCLTEFPGGMCSLTCESDGDCPTGSACVDVQGGVCLMECEEDRDCPGGFECDDEDRVGHSGKVYICEED